MERRVVYLFFCSAIIAGVFWGSAASASADQSHSPARRPKIGLALSGGGAMGLAHIGVIEMLEEHGIPIDYIAGTSMGSVIGGLYASGLSISEIRDKLRQIDWNDIFDDEPKRKYLSFDKKKENQRYVFDIELGVKKWGVVLPKGLSAGQKLSYLLSCLTLHTQSYTSFDQFPIPFRAVACDIATGEKVVLDKGSLPIAIRASMAVPMVFTPVEIDGRLLVDGGLVENLPVKTVKDMGADIVIAVNVSEPLLSRDQLGNFLSISAQSFKIIGLKSAEENAKLADVLIIPELKGLNPVDFDEVDAFAKRGQEATAQSIAAIMDKIPAREDEKVEYPSLGVDSSHTSFAPQFFRIEGCKKISPHVIEAGLKDLKGVQFDPVEFDKRIARLYGTGYYESIIFKPVKEGTEEGILLHVEEKPWGPNYLHFGTSFQTNFSNDTAFNFLTNLDFCQLNRLGGEIRNDFIIGTEYRVSSEFYQPIRYEQDFFIAPGFVYQKDYRNYFQGKTRFAQFEVEMWGGKFDVGYQWENIFELRQGIRVTKGTAEVVTGPLLLGSTIEQLFVPIVTTAELDTLDSRAFPTTGSYVKAEADIYRTSLGNEQDYDIIRTHMRQYITLWNRHVLSVWLSTGASFNKVPYYQLFYIGGLNQFAGYKREQLAGRYYGITRWGYMYRLCTLPSFLGKAVYLGGWSDIGNVWVDRDDLEKFRIHYSGTLGFGLDTKIGAVYFGASKAEEEKAVVSLGIGNEF